MATPTVQEICDSIWTYSARTLRNGVPLIPTTLLEGICDACWTNGVRTLTFFPMRHHLLEGPSKQTHVVEGPSKQTRILIGS